MASVSVHSVVSKLNEDTTVIRGYKRLAGGLQVAESDYLAVENLFRNGTAATYSLLTKIIELWLFNANYASGGPGAEELKTVGQLTSCLQKEAFTASAECLLKAFGSASTIEGSQCTPKKVTTLLQRQWWPEKKPLPNSFVERRTEHGRLLVDELDNMIHQGAPKAVNSQKATISGLGGIGKSSLAKWYANYFANRFDLIIWLDCGENSLSSSIQNFWNRLHEATEFFSKSGTAEQAHECFTELKGYRTLFVYDNAEEYGGNEGIKHALPSALEFPKMVCVITSRCTLWGSRAMFGVIPKLHLSTLSMEESTHLLRSCLEDVDATNADLEKLTEALGYLPLALQIAIAHLNEHYAHRRDGVRMFNDVLVKSYDSVLIPSADLDDYQKGVLTTLSLTVSKVKDHVELGELAWRWLCTMAYQEPTVPLTFMLCVEQLSKDMGFKICDLLRKYSLLDYSRTWYSQDYDITMHRLLQRTLEILCHSESGEHRLRILNCEISNPAFAKFKWKSYLAFSQRTDVQFGFMEIAKDQINKGLSMRDIRWNQNIQEAFALVRIYDEMNQRICQPHENAVSALCYQQYHLQELVLKESDLQWSPNYFFNDCIICYMKGEICYRLGNKNQALLHWDEARKNALLLSVVPNANRYVGGYNIFSVWMNSPHGWEWPKQLQPVLDNSELLTAQVLFELKKLEEGKNHVQEIAKRRGRRLSVLGEHLPVTLRLHEIVGSHFNVLSLFFVYVSYESALMWVKNISSQELSECEFQNLIFVRNDGSFVENVELHHILPAKCHKICVISNEANATKTCFDVSKMWPGTRMLHLKGCKVLWDFPQRGKYKTTNIVIDSPINSFLDSKMKWDGFSRLKLLSICTAQVPLHLIPSSVVALALEEVDIRGEKGDLTPRIQCLSLSKYFDFETILQIINLFHFEELELRFCDYKARHECKQAEECGLIKTLQSSSNTKIESPLDSLKEHLERHNFFPPSKFEREYRFRGSTQDISVYRSKMSYLEVME